MKINTPKTIVATVFTVIALFCWFFMAPLATLLQPLVLFGLFCIAANRTPEKATAKKIEAVFFYGVVSLFGYWSFSEGGVRWLTFLVGNTLFVWGTTWFLSYGYYYHEPEVRTSTPQ